MNRIITDNANATKYQPLVADSGIGSIPFLQDGIAESIWSMLLGLIGSYTMNDLIVLDGIVHTITNSGNTDTWTKGAIGYNGEIYTVDAGTVTKTGGQTFIFQLLNSFSGTLDPIIFTDNSSASVHQVRKITILAGNTGTGIADYNGATVKKYIDLMTGSWVSLSSSLVNGFTATFIRYKLDHFGNVTIQGRVSSGVSSGSDFITSLPSSIRLPSASGSGNAFYFVARNVSLGLEYNIQLDGNSPGTLSVFKDTQTTQTNIPDNTEFQFMFSYSVL